MCSCQLWLELGPPAAAILHPANDDNKPPSLLALHSPVSTLALSSTCPLRLTPCLIVSPGSLGQPPPGPRTHQRLRGSAPIIDINCIDCCVHWQLEVSNFDIHVHQYQLFKYSSKVLLVPPPPFRKCQKADVLRPTMNGHFNMVSLPQILA